MKMRGNRSIMEYPKVVNEHKDGGLFMTTPVIFDVFSDYI
jgi:hypothetical protein